MMNIRHSIGIRPSLTLAAIAVAIAAAACTDNRELPTARAPRGAIGQPGYALIPAGTKLACPPAQGFAARLVTAGAESDANGNGTVCDRKTGAGGDEKTLTLDDVVVPANLVQSAPPPPPPAR